MKKLLKTTHRTALAVTSTLLLTVSGSLLALDEGVLATVNGEPISSELVEIVTRQLESGKQPIDNQRILDELINLQLLTDLAIKAGVDKEKDIANVLKLQRTQILANAYMRTLSEDITISDEDMQQEYDTQIAKMAVSEYRASHILLESEEDAKAVIQALADGSDFVELAKEKSTGPSGPNGGDLGWFKADTMVPEFAAAVQEMEAGSTSQEAVKTDFGWHVIKLDETRGTPAPPFEQVKEQIRNVLTRDKLNEKVAELRKDATVELAE